MGFGRRPKLKGRKRNAGSRHGFRLIVLQDSDMNSMVVTTDSMHVTMSQFFLGRCSYVNNSYVKVKSFASERMIGIHSDFPLSQFNNRHNHDFIVSLRLKLHARTEILDTGELGPWNHFHQSLISFTVTFFRLHANLEGITFFLSNKGTLKTRNDVPHAQNEGQGVLASGRIDQIALVVFDGIIHEND
jgi:hypothetical protein